MGCRLAGETRTVDVHVGQLRKKLGLTEKIKTISKWATAWRTNHHEAMDQGFPRGRYYGCGRSQHL